MDTLLIRNGTVVNAEDGTMVQADILAEGSGIRKAEPGICDLWRGRLLWFWSHNGCGCREHGLRDL